MSPHIYSPLDFRPVLTDTAPMRMKDRPNPVAGLGTFFLLGRYRVDALDRLVRDGWNPGETFLDSKGREYVVAPGGNLVRFYQK